MSSSELESAIQETLGRLVQFYKPHKVYLFGSAARGEMSPGSDLDFMVVLPDEAPQSFSARVRSTRDCGAFLALWIS